MGKDIRKRSIDVWVMPRRLYRIAKRELPAQKQSGVGRPAVSHRLVLNAIWYVLWTGCQWSAIRVEHFGVSKTTAHARLREWLRQGVWLRLWRRLLRGYGRKHHIRWQWRAIDTRRVPAPLGGAHTGPNPTDRGKRGIKLHLLVDQQGAPLAVVLTGANRHDKTQVSTLLDSQVLIGPAYHLCADRGYDYQDIWDDLRARGYSPHIRHRRRRNEPLLEPALPPGEAVHPARRWVVERTFSWLSKPRSLRTCWAKTLDTWLALVILACCHILANGSIFG